MADPISASIFLDLRRALGDDPAHPLRVLTKRQRLAIQHHLIENNPVNKTAEKMGVAVNVVYITVRRGLTRLLKYLQDGETPGGWLDHEIALLCDPDYTIDEIAAKLGKTPHAVENAMSRYRSRYDIPYRTRRNRR